MNSSSVFATFFPSTVYRSKMLIVMRNTHIHIGELAFHVNAIITVCERLFFHYPNQNEEASFSGMFPFWTAIANVGVSDGTHRANYAFLKRRTHQRTQGLKLSKSNDDVGINYLLSYKHTANSARGCTVLLHVRSPALMIITNSPVTHLGSNFVYAVNLENRKNAIWL